MKKVNGFGLCAVFLTNAILSGCGGGGGSEEIADSGNSASALYEEYPGNANKEVILDGAGMQFAVRKVDRRLVFLSANQGLSGLTVADNGDLIRSERKVGAVILNIGADGRKVAFLACSGPAPDFGAMTITVNSNEWIYRCASNTATTFFPNISPTDPNLTGNTNTTNSAVGVTANGGPETPPSAQTPASTAVKINITSRIVTNGTFNLWRISLENPNAYTVRCFVQGVYRYSDPNGTGKLIYDQATRSVTVPGGGVGNAEFGLTDRNIQADSYKVLSCTRI